MAKGPAKQPAGARAPQWHVAAIEIARIVAVVAGVVALVALLWFARTALLLLFAGVLLAVLLDGLSRPLMRWTGMPKPAALSVVVLSIGIFLSLVAWNAGPVLIEQLQELGRSFTQTVASAGQEAADQADQSGMLRDFNWSELIGWLPSPLGIATGATAVASTVLGAIASVLIVIFLGIYLALSPELYVNLLLRFAPTGRRAEFRSVIEEMGAVLNRWLNGQLLAMARSWVWSPISDFCSSAYRSPSCLHYCSECSSSFPISVPSSAPRRCCSWERDRAWTSSYGWPASI
jgi:predicted PurR-regulated permease PerM